MKKQWKKDGRNNGNSGTMETNEETMETVRDFYFILFYLAPKSLKILTAAMKLKDACSLEEKL